MARNKGSANFSGSFEVLAGAPVDARTVVNTKSDLTAQGSYTYKYTGMIVSVKDEQKVFMLIGDDPTIEENWKEIGPEVERLPFIPRYVSSKPIKNGLPTFISDENETFSNQLFDGTTFTPYPYLIWTNGTDIYFSYSHSGEDPKQYVYNREKNIWETAPATVTLNDTCLGSNIWSDGTDIYYSDGLNQYILNRKTNIWESYSWINTPFSLSTFIGQGVWYDGECIYFTNSYNTYELNKNTKTWSDITSKIHNGLDSGYVINTDNVWTDGVYLYFSNKYNENSYRWNDKDEIWESIEDWNGTIPTYFSAKDIWSDGIKIYLSCYDRIQENNKNYEYNVITKNWRLVDFGTTLTRSSSFSGQNIWSDGINIYFIENNGNIYKLVPNDDYINLNSEIIDSNYEIKSLKHRTLTTFNKIKEIKVQYSEIPNASIGLLNKIIQYIGQTNLTYTNGYFYKCVENGQGGYIWQNISVQQGGGGGSYTAGDGIDITNNEISIDEMPSTDMSEIISPLPNAMSRMPILFDESETERQIGWYKYSNGTKKPVYEICMTGTTPNTYDSWSNFKVFNDDIDKIIFDYLTIERANNESYPGIYIHDYAVLFKLINNNTLQIRIKDEYLKNHPYNFTIQYTKTIDTPS